MKIHAKIQLPRKKTQSTQWFGLIISGVSIMSMKVLNAMQRRMTESNEGNSTIAFRAMRH
jgi:hypothetical protein